MPGELRDNVLIGRDGRVRVVDFGLSCGGGGQADATGEDASPLDRVLTRTGSVMGTPAYMAPSSTPRGSYVGGWLLGCGTGDVAVPVRAVIGDGTERGSNVFRGLHEPAASVAACGSGTACARW